MEDTAELHAEVTEFVNEFLQYKLSQNGYQWSCATENRQQEEDETGSRPIGTKVGAALRSLADEFSSQYKENFVEMCEKLDINESSIKPTIVGIANELFSEGIKWARIVALFVFGSELAMHCQDRNWPHLTTVISQTIASYITEKLLPWINDHGGWDGLVAFNENADLDTQSNGRWPSMKNILCFGISALGALSLGAFLAKS